MIDLVALIESSWQWLLGLGLLTIIGISWAIHWAIFYVNQYKKINEKLDKIMQKLGIEDKNAK